MNDFRAEAVCFNEVTTVLVSCVQNHDLLFLQIRLHIVGGYCKMRVSFLLSTVYHC